MSISQNFPEEGPSLNLNFAGSRALDPRITFTRTSSATYTDDNGLIRTASANSPRFDHRFNPTTGEIDSLGLLIEENRANLTTFSEQLDNARWAVNNLTLSSDTTETTAPDGSNNAEKVLETVTNSYHSFCNFNAYGIIAGTVYTASIFIKSINKEFVQLVFDDNATTNGGYVNFNLTSGTITASANYGTGTNIAGTITSYPNGWYRLSITSTAGTTGTFGRFSINGLTSGTSGPFPGYVGNTSNGYYIWGAQLEQGSFPTSYIPTSGTTATRTVDNASITGSNFSDWYNPSEGTVVISSSTYTDGSDYNNALIFSDGSLVNLNNSIEMALTASGLNKNVGRVTIRKDGSSVFDSGAGSTITTLQTNKKYKIASSFKKDNFNFTIDGVTDEVGISGELPSNLNTLLIGYIIASGSRLNGYIQQLVYYPTALPSNQLITLTK